MTTKGTMTVSRKLGARLAIASVMLIAASGAITPANAQPQLGADQLAQLQLVDPAQVPAYGTFWKWIYGSNGQTFGAPLPMDPYGTNVAVYYLSDGQFLINNGPDDPTLLQQQQLEAQMTMAQPMQESSGLDQPNGGSLMGDSFAPGTFYICSIAVTNQMVNLVLSNTTSGVQYEILAGNSLTNVADWVSAGPFEGLDGSTPATIAVGDFTNQLFLRAKSYVDADGNDLPDWWEQRYFGTNGIDPYFVLADGWTVVQNYDFGWSPNDWHTPPPPQNVAAVLDASGTSILLTWASGGGPVTQYAVEDGGGDQLAQVSSNTFTYTDALGYDPAVGPYSPSALRVRAYFPDGSSVGSQLVYPSDPALATSGGVARGADFNAFLVISPMPAGASSIRLVSYLGYAPIDIPASSFHNGTLLLTNWAVLQGEGYAWARAISASGGFGVPAQLNETVNPTYQELWNWRRNDPNFSVPRPEGVFVNASHQMKENLRFLLRSSMVTWPFGYTSNRNTDGSNRDTNSVDPYYDVLLIDQPELCYGRPPGSGDYEYYGFHVYSPNLGWSMLDEMRPVQENFLWTNLLLSAIYPYPGSWDDNNRARQISTPDQPFQPSGNDTNPPLAFTLSADDAWTYGLTPILTSDPSQIGISYDANWNATVLPNVVNNYGLALRSVATFDAGDDLVVLHPGDSSFGEDFFTDFTAPALRTTNYYFASQTPYLTRYSWTSDGHSPYFYSGPPMPIPGSPGFSPTNTSPLLITSIGQPITVSAWAKMAIDNGAADKFGYLEQYTEQALVIDQSGNITTNQAGIVSPYGGFFPTMAGPAALVTMPDIDNGQRGTGVVNVI